MLTGIYHALLGVRDSSESGLADELVMTQDVWA
jgi:hypothetical protein